jgi:hypothetical protein
MTKSTDTKNIKKIVQGILKRNYVADNLQLEIDLVSAFMRYMFEREEGVTPGESKDKITAELGFFGTEHTDKARMMQLLMDTLGVEVDETKTEWVTVINFCIEAEKKNQTVSAYRAWMNRDPYNSPKKHQIAQTPLLIKQTWMSAFEEIKKTEEVPGEYRPRITA